MKLLSSLYNIPMVAVYGWIRAVQEIDASTCVHPIVHTSGTVHSSGRGTATSVYTSDTVHKSGLGAYTSTHTSGLGASTSTQYSTTDTNTNAVNVMSSSELSVCCRLVINLLESFRS